MAGAVSDEHGKSGLPDDSRRVISVLLLGTRWQFDTYGLSTINKSLINNLRFVDPDGKTIKITCAIQQDEGKIKDEDLKDAKKHGVELKGEKWLDEDRLRHYPDVVQDKIYDFIIGHAPYMANVCLNLKAFYRNKKETSKTILLFHALPMDAHGDIDDEVLLNWLKEADVVVSIGKPVEDELLPYIAALDPEKRPIHKMYLPSVPMDFCPDEERNVQENIRGTQHVCMMSGDIKNLDKNDLDFTLAVTAAARASEHLRNFDGVRMRLTLLIANGEEKAKWKDVFEEILRTHHPNDTGLSFQIEAPHTIEQINIHMRKSNLFLLPLMHNSPLLGTEALVAIATGVPVLISKYSGLSAVLNTMIEDEPIVGKNKLTVNAESWKERIIEKLVRPTEAQKAVNRLRERLLAGTNITQTHLDFINVIAGTFLEIIKKKYCILAITRGQYG